MAEANEQAVSIEHGRAERARILFVDWMLGNTCNYACSYCPDGLHDGSRKWHSLDSVERFVALLIAFAGRLNKTVHIQFTGGEVTLRPQFLGLLTRLRALGCTLSLISNGSRTERWWHEAAPKLEAATLTFHSEFADADSFIRVVNIVSAVAATHVNVSAIPDRFSLSVGFAERLATECRNVSILLKPMFLDFGERLYPYTPEQLQILANQRFRTVLTDQSVRARGEMLVTYESGRREIVRPNSFIVSGTNRWRGWVCNVGLELLSVDVSGNVYRGLCKEGGLLGNIDEAAEFRLPSEPVTCTRNACNCLLDVMTSRRSGSEGRGSSRPSSHTVYADAR